ncbi:MAG: gluconate 2-dehydrogenase subunit 3 family protein [Alphaproteobacteria bacterium]
MANVFDLHQRATIEAAAERIVPADHDAGARQTGVINYVESALGGYDAEYAPLYITGVQELDKLARERFALQAFVQLRSDQQDEILAHLEKEGSHFFSLLLEHTMQGFYGDPRHGGNRDGASWKMIGFPGPTHPKGYQPPFGWYDKNIPDEFDPDKKQRN